MSTLTQDRLNSIIDPRAKQRSNAHTYTTTHGNENVNVDKIKHIFIVLVGTSNKVSVSTLKTMYISHTWPPMLVGPPANCPSVPMR